MRKNVCLPFISLLLLFLTIYSSGGIIQAAKSRRTCASTWYTAKCSKQQPFESLGDKNFLNETLVYKYNHVHVHIFRLMTLIFVYLFITIERIQRYAGLPTMLADGVFLSIRT